MSYRQSALALVTTALLLSGASHRGCEEIPEDQLMGGHSFELEEEIAAAGVLNGQSTGYQRFKSTLILRGWGRVCSSTLIDPKRMTSGRG